MPAQDVAGCARAQRDDHPPGVHRHHYL